VQFSPTSSYFLRLCTKFLPHHPAIIRPHSCSSLNVIKQVSRPYKTAGKIRNAQIIQKYRSHLKIVGARRVTCSKFNTDDPLVLGAIMQNLFATATWRPGCFTPLGKIMETWALFCNWKRKFKKHLLKTVKTCRALIQHPRQCLCMV
jgi:hypothetical protein